MAKTRREPNGCLVWTAFKVKGYGRFQAASRRGYQAHRWIYEQTVGPIPDGLTLDHLCRNRSCVEVKHLEPVTPGENTLRGEGPTAQNKRKTHCIRGHEFTPENTEPNSGGHRGGRRCVICNRLSAQASRLRRGLPISANAMARLRAEGFLP